MTLVLDDLSVEESTLELRQLLLGYAGTSEDLPLSGLIANAVGRLGYTD